jgi:hypothetical protein
VFGLFLPQKSSISLYENIVTCSAWRGCKLKTETRCENETCHVLILFTSRITPLGYDCFLLDKAINNKEFENSHHLLNVIAFVQLAIKMGI